MAHESILVSRDGVYVKKTISVSTPGAKIYDYYISGSVDDVRVYDDFGPLRYNVARKGDSTAIRIIFRKTIGKNDNYKFYIEYRDPIKIKKLGKLNYTRRYVGGKTKIVGLQGIPILFAYRSPNKDGSGYTLHLEWGEPPIYTYEYRIKLKAKKDTENIRIRIVRPWDGGRQKILEEHISANFSISEAEEGEWMEIEIEDLKEGEQLDVVYEAKIRVTPDIITDRNWNVANPTIIENPYHDIEHPKIKQIAQKYKKKSNYETALALLRYVERTMIYDDSLPKRRKASEVLASKRGVCMNYADLYVALLKAAGIPARIVGGFVDGELHAWVEIQALDDRWIESDPTWGVFGGIGAVWVIQKKELTSSEDSLISTIMSYSYRGGPLVVDSDMKVKI